MNVRFLSIALGLLLACAMFITGILYHKYRFFPYDLVRSAANVAERRVVGLKDVIAQQYSRDNEPVVLGRQVDTTLLPLRINGVRISEHYALPKVAGAITTIGNKVIILDRLGGIYSSGSRGENVQKLSFPDLPNNIADYLSSRPDVILDDKRFRAYSIKYLDFAKSLAVSHEYFDVQNKKSRIAISIIPIDEETLNPSGNWQTIFLGDSEPQGPNEQGGGHLAAQGPDKIYLTVGDYEIIDPMVTQDPNSKMGKILAIDLNTREVKTISTGHRNPEGLIIDTKGNMLSTEHGPAGGDELNVIVEGGNYGWPVVTLGTAYNSYKWRDSKSVGTHSGYRAPLYAWIPSIGVSSLLEVQGFNKRWDGDLLVASLKAQTLFRLRLDKGRVLYAEPIWIGQRIRDIAQLKDGTIVLWTDDTELQFISVDNQRLEKNERNPAGTGSTLTGACMYCHHFGPTGPSDFAPSLTNVIGRKIGSDNYRYSAALRNKDGAWTEESLRRFIANPDAFATGTAMPNLHLSEDQLDEVLDDIRNNSAAPQATHR